MHFLKTCDNLSKKSICLKTIYFILRPHHALSESSMFYIEVWQQFTGYLHLKIVKIHFHGVIFLWSILVSKMPELWRSKLWDKAFVPFDSGNMQIEESKKQGFKFSIKLTMYSKLFKVIFWKIHFSFEKLRFLGRNFFVWVC